MSRRKARGPFPELAGEHPRPVSPTDGDTRTGHPLPVDSGRVPWKMTRAGDIIELPQSPAHAGRVNPDWRSREGLVLAMSYILVVPSLTK